MGKLKRWLVNTYLPSWAREELWAENQKLKAKVAEPEAEIKRQDVFIAGMENAMRYGRKVIINMEERRHEPCVRVPEQGA